jgi:CubicO group peptidase (beta-lactamase class C family)
MRVIGVLTLTLVTWSQTSSPDAPSAIVKHIEAELAQAKVPGAAIAVVSGNHVVASGYGIARAGEPTAMTPLTLVQVGSLTKLFTALAVTSALDANNLPMPTPLGDVNPGLSARAAATTFHQLLAQTSGLRDQTGGDGTNDELALASAAREIDNADFILPADVVFSYSNVGYALAGAGLEWVAKVGFADALRTQALRPLGMERSTVRPSEVASQPHAAGHRLDSAKPVAIASPANDVRLWPSGYLWTNATDMSRAMLAIINKGEVSGYPGLKPEVIERVTTAHTPMPNIFVGGHYGYGLMLGRERGVLVYEHGGTLPGFSSILRVAPERRVGVAILANLDNAPLRRIAQAVVARALSLPADAAPRSPTEAPVIIDEMKPFIGRYENRGTAELAERDGKVVFILDGSPPFAVSRIGEHRYLARPKPDVAGPEFVIQPATSSSPAYLHFALWAYVRRE